MPRTTSGTVTVTETFPIRSDAGVDDGNGLDLSTLQRRARNSAPLAGGASYPAITVTVNVASNATSPQMNAVSVSGGGSVEREHHRLDNHQRSAGLSIVKTP